MSWVIVTGAAGGIGSVICSSLQDAGYSIIGVDKRADGQGAVDRFIHSDIAGILDDPDFRAELKSEILEIIGGESLHALINNAAIQLLGSVEDLDIQDFRSSMDINVAVPMMLSQMFFKPLAESNGTILNVGSIHASLTKPGFISYATSKAALAGLTRSLAVDAGDRVKVLGIQPAAVATRMLLEGFSDDPEALSRLEGFHPSRTIALPQDIAEFVQFLISSECQFLNGTMLDVNGGIGARLHDPV